VIPGLPVHDRRHSRVLQSPLAAPRAGVMLHYDDSGRDAWALAWFSDPRCTNGYTWLVLDDGAVVELADPAHRTPHAGACLTPNANSAFYGLSAATNGLVPVTTPQMNSLVATCVALFRYHGWPAADLSARIRGHDAEAIWTPGTTRAAGIDDARGRALWNKLGRKVDPIGNRKDRRPIIDVAEVRRAVARSLGGLEGGDDASH
jgi:hypothetical protein